VLEAAAVDPFEKQVVVEPEHRPAPYDDVRLESGPAEDRRHFLLRVTPQVACPVVPVRPLLWSRGDGADQPTAGREHPRELGKCAVVVRYVLHRLCAGDACESLAGKWKPCDIGDDRQHAVSETCGLGAIAENAKRKRRQVGGHHDPALASQGERKRSHAGRAFEVETGTRGDFSQPFGETPLTVRVPRPEELGVSAPLSLSHRCRIAILQLCEPLRRRSLGGGASDLTSIQHQTLLLLGLLPSPPMPEVLQPEWIDTAEGVRQAADLVAASGRLALDTEADSMHSYFHKVCLIQVTADGRHMVIDPLKLEADDLQPLWRMVADPAFPVLMHGSDYDFRVLDRDYGARIHGLQDTQIMALLLGEEKTGLAALLEKEMDIRLDKRHQRADWGRRPLTRSQVAYAAADTAYLGELVKVLRARLEDLGRWSWAVEEFQSLELVRYSPPESDPVAFERIKGARALRGEARDRLFTLHGWRDQMARALDVPPFKVLGNRQLLLLSENPPGDLVALGEVEGLGPRAVRRWGNDLLQAVGHPRGAPERVRLQRPPNPTPEVGRRLKNLMAARDAKAKELGLQEGLVCSRSLTDAVALRQPRCSRVADLEESGLRGWRLDVLGVDFLKALAES